MYLPALIDTHILSELFKGNNTVKARVSEYVKEHHSLTISQITKYEILKGLKAKKAQKQINAFKTFCNANTIISITDDIIIKASDIYAELRQQGETLSDADILVAAIAIVNNLTLITNNTKHFTRIKSLKLDNWKS